MCAREFVSSSLFVRTCILTLADGVCDCETIITDQANAEFSFDYDWKRQQIRMRICSKTPKRNDRNEKGTDIERKGRQQVHRWNYTFSVCIILLLNVLAMSCGYSKSQTFSVELLAKANCSLFANSRSVHCTLYRAVPCCVLCCAVLFLYCQCMRLVFDFFLHVCVCEYVLAFVSLSLCFVYDSGNCTQHLLSTAESETKW